MCGVSLLSILLVVASLLTVLHQYHLYQVCVIVCNDKDILTSCPDPGVAQYNVCMSSDRSTMISFQVLYSTTVALCSFTLPQPLDGYQYSITNESECSNATSSNTNVFQIPYPHNCTVLTVLAEHNCTEGMIPVDISNVTS